MKGISPLVAVVLLIAITMTVAGVLAYWASGFVRSSLPSQNQTSTLQQCISADFEINPTTNYNSTTHTLNLILQNTAGVDLTITNVSFVYTDGVESRAINQPLPMNSMKSFPVTNVREGFITYTVFTNCPKVYRSAS